MMATLQIYGVRGLALNRSLRQDDWMVLAVGDTRVLAIQTDDDDVDDDRIGVVVRTPEPPNEVALPMLAQFMSGEPCETRATDSLESQVAWIWVLDTARRILAPFGAPRSRC